jgi:hypothetical protein
VSLSSAPSRSKIKINVSVHAQHQEGEEGSQQKQTAPREEHPYQDRNESYGGTTKWMFQAIVSRIDFPSFSLSSNTDTDLAAEEKKKQL